MAKNMAVRLPDDPAAGTEALSPTSDPPTRLSTRPTVDEAEAAVVAVASGEWNEDRTAEWRDGCHLPRAPERRFVANIGGGTRRNEETR